MVLWNEDLALELMEHAAFALTKMDWNNDALNDAVPVSIRYSQRLERSPTCRIFPEASIRIIFFM